MNKSTLISVFIALICCALSVYLHETNLFYLEKQKGSKQTLISTADEASYIRPPQNWLEGKDWKDSSVGNSAYVQRPPGYGLIFLFCKIISPNQPLIILKFLQILAFFVSIILFQKIIYLTTNNIKIALTFTAIYGLLPCYSGFMYYTLTEAVSPFFLLLLTHSFLQVLLKEKPPYLFVLTLMFFLILRPQLMIFPILYVLFLLSKNYSKWWVYLIGFLPFFIWQIRTYTITNEISIHPIYSYTNKSVFRPPHQSLTNLFRVWEYKSDRFHNIVGLLARDTSKNNLYNALKNIPDKYQKEVLPTLRAYQKVVFYQKKAFKEEKTLTALPIELSFTTKTDQLAKNLFLSNPIDAVILTPIKSGIELFKKSHLNLWVFQKEWRGNVFNELLRWICLLVIILSFITVIPFLFIKPFPKYIKLVFIGVLLSVFYLVWIQRLNEERYMTPLLPIMLICLAVASSTLFNKTTQLDRKSIKGK
ncbi:MAG: hypothetical protein WED10_12455 [Brumimicrobium sp.]